jgi:hypothetical protein
VTLDTYAPTLQAGFASLPLPPNAVPAPGSDQHLVVWQPSTDSMWEFWKLHLATNGWHARWGARIFPAVDVTKLGLSRVGLIMARAAQRYGIVVRDQAGSVTFYGEDPAQYGSPNPYGALFGGQYPNQVLAKFPSSSLQVVQPRA